MKLRTILCAAALVAGISYGGSVQIPGGTQTLLGTSSSGVSFTYNGTLTQNDTIDLTVSGTPCLQYSLQQYCTNGAGVIVIAGTSGVGQSTSFSGTFGGTTRSWAYGSLVMIVSGAGAVPVFTASAANGLGSSSPPSSLTLPTATLASLGFGSFSVANPTITFILADSFWGDNSGQWVISQAAPPPAVPAPGTWLLILTALAALSGAYWYRTIKARSAAH